MSLFVLQILSAFAAILELAGLWCVGNKKKIAFIILSLANVLWIIIAINSEIYGLMAIGIAAILVHVRNYLKWL